MNHNTHKYSAKQEALYKFRINTINIQRGIEWNGQLNMNAAMVAASFPFISPAAFNR